jgi:hypothetical protein
MKKMGREHSDFLTETTILETFKTEKDTIKALINTKMAIFMMVN